MAAARFLTPFRYSRPIIQRSSYFSTKTASAQMSESEHAPGPVENSIRSKLTEQFKPSSLNIENDSWKHSHHAPMRAIGGGSGETHFSVELVSDLFEGKKQIQRHRMVNAALKDEFNDGLHALSLKLKTPDEA